jgi:hypothetical protein
MATRPQAVGGIEADGKDAYKDLLSNDGGTAEDRGAAGRTAGGIPGAS